MNKQLTKLILDIVSQTFEKGSLVIVLVFDLNVHFLFDIMYHISM